MLFYVLGKAKVISYLFCLGAGRTEKCGDIVTGMSEQGASRMEKCRDIVGGKSEQGAGRMEMSQCSKKQVGAGSRRVRGGEIHMSGVISLLLETYVKTNTMV